MVATFEKLQGLVLQELLSAREEVKEEFESLLEGNDPKRSEEAVLKIFEQLISFVKTPHSFIRWEPEEVGTETPYGFYIGEQVRFIGTTYGLRSSFNSAFGLTSEQKLGYEELPEYAEVTIVGFRKKAETMTGFDIYMVEWNDTFFFVNHNDIRKLK